MAALPDYILVIETTWPGVKDKLGSYMLLALGKVIS